MLLNLNRVLTDVKGEALKEKAPRKPDTDPDAPVEQMDVTLNHVVASALLNPVKEDDGEIVMGKYLLAVRCYDAEEVTLTSEEITLIKACVARSYPPIIAGQAWAVLEQKVS